MTKLSKPTKEQVIRYKQLKDAISALNKELKPLDKQLKEYFQAYGTDLNYRGVNCIFKVGQSMRFNKDLFLESNTEADYNSYKVSNESVSIVISNKEDVKKAA